MKLRVFTALVFVQFLIAASLPLLKYRALDDNGDPVSGAKLYFYEAGTTTPLATYSDEDLSSANANPVVADSDGWFGEIYLKTDQSYKVAMNNSDDSVTYWTVDDINAAQLVSDAFQSRLKQAASNPIDYGAVGDGVADEYTHVQSAIDNATMSVDLLGKTYRCDSTITVPSHRVIKNGTLDFSNSSSNDYITITGSVGNPVVLDADAALGATVLSPASAVGFSTGDWIYVESDDTWSGSSATAGEMYKISAISGGDFIINRPTKISYTSATATGIYKVTDVSNVVFENVTIIASTGASGTGNVINAEYATGLKIVDSTIDGPKGAAIEIKHSAMTEIRNTKVIGGLSSSSYGVRIKDGCYGTSVTDSTFIYLDYGIYADINLVGQDGLIVSTDISRNAFNGCYAPINLPSQVLGVVISNNNITDSSDSISGGIICNSQSSVISGNVVKQCTDGHGIYSSIYVHTTDAASRQDAVVISDNIISFSDEEGVYVTQNASSGNIDSLSIVGNAIDTTGTGTSCILADIDTADSVAIDGNSIVSCGTNGIYTFGVSSRISNNTIKNVGAASSGISAIGSTTVAAPSIFGNNISGQAVSGVLVQGYYNADIHGNNISGTSTTMSSGVYVAGTNGPQIKVSDNVISSVDNASGSGVTILNNANVSVTPDVLIIGNTVQATTGITVTLSSEPISHLTVSGNIVKADDGFSSSGTQAITDSANFSNNSFFGANSASSYSLSIVGYANDISFSGNRFERDDDLDHNVLLSGSAGGAITNVMFTGNTFENGDYAIGEGTDANTTRVSAVGNTFNGLTTFASEYGVRLLSNDCVDPAHCGYEFKAALGSDVDPLVDATVTKIAFGVVAGYDFDYEYGVTISSGTFTAPVDGVYNFDSVVHFESYSSSYADNAYCAIIVNIGGTANVISGSVHSFLNPTSVDESTCVASSIVRLLAGDTVAVYYYVEDSSSPSDIKINYDAGRAPITGARSYFSGALIR